jgi:hypothetical protein
MLLLNILPNGKPDKKFGIDGKVSGTVGKL